MSAEARRREVRVCLHDHPNWDIPPEPVGFYPYKYLSFIPPDPRTFVEILLLGLVSQQPFHESPFAYRPFCPSQMSSTALKFLSHGCAFVIRIYLLVGLRAPTHPLRTPAFGVVSFLSLWLYTSERISAP